ncbi:AslA Arylsulfatase A and related enzymes [Acidimicrobiia bacterium]
MPKTDSVDDAYKGFEGKVGRVFATSESWWPPRPESPKGAPNVVVILVDDLGYADLSCYGSEIDTPNIDRLAHNGLQYIDFHSTPMCSPTRAAFLTGLNPHAAGVGTVAHADPGFPGYAMELADDVGTLPETLRANGYATYMVGKWHLAKDSDQSDAGPRHSWPCQRGFDQFYGFLDGFTNLHHPHRLVRDNTPVEIDTYPEGYYLTDDLTDEALAMIKAGKASNPEQPFFLYVAHGAIHAPLHAKADDIETQRGRYADGWDEIRARRFARQRELGIVDANTELAPRNSEANNDVLAWDTLDATQQELYARYMEVFAAMVSDVDRNTGRLLNDLEAMGELDNTIVIFMSDNGASREGEMVGTTAYMVHLTTGDDVETDFERLDLIGGPQSSPHYPRGWAMAGNTPFRLYKINTHAGGHTVPFLFSWPAGHLDEGQKRRQYSHVSDLAPTLLELIGVDPLAERNGVAVKTMTGSSMVPTLRAADAPAQRTEAIYEMIGHRGFYRDGWEIVTLHQPFTPFHETEWELYNLIDDRTELHNLADLEPEKLAELAAAWESAAWDGQIFPLDEGTGLKYVLRPPRNEVVQQPLTLWRGTPTLERWRALQLIWLRSFTFALDVVVTASDIGTLVAHGDQSGGYALYIVENSTAVLMHNNGRGKLTTITAPGLTAVRHSLEASFEAIGSNTWRMSLLVDGSVIGEPVDVTMLYGMSPFEGISIGRDPRSPVWWERHVTHGSFHYSGEMGPVTFTPGAGPPDQPPELVDILRQMGARYE